MKRFMNYIYSIFVFSLFLQNNAFAIDWHLLITPTGRQVYIDKDSIQEIKNHYFYNIKFTNPGSDKFVIITMQSAKKHPYSARTKAYELDEYDRLNGDYHNIASHYTDNLEPVTYKSVVNTCYKYVEGILNPNKRPTIIIE